MVLREGDVKISADMPAKLWKAARVRAIQNGETLREMLIRLLERELGTKKGRKA
jgi:hypothetical protein